MSSIFFYTPSGVTVSPLDGFDGLKVSDVAIALGRIRRFCGALETSYTVAQHSVLVSELVEPELALAALFHDAHEMFCNDVPSPAKKLFQHLAGSAWGDFEDYLQDGMCKALNVPMFESYTDEWKVIHEADKQARYIEIVSCMGEEKAKKALTDIGKEHLLYGIVPEPVWDGVYASSVFLEKVEEYAD